MNRYLVDVAAGRIKRLMVMMPPRHGKSQLVSRYFPAWYLGVFPDRRIILASYEADFAAGWGRQARNLLEEWGQALFGVTVSPESSAAYRWDIAGHDGGMVTAGVGGPITGRGAHVLIIDDPVKNRAEAESRTIRDATWDWWTSTALTRLEPGGSVVLVMTRWHEDDLAGRLLRQQEQAGDDWDGERWTVLRLPALAEENDPLGRRPGEALWPERFDERALAAKRAEVGAYDWAALYQQRPQPRGGGMFKREWFERIVEHTPEGLRWVRYWDLATSTGDKADYTAGALVGMAKDGTLYIAHMVRLRAEWPDTRRIIKATALADGRHVEVGVEKVAFQLAAWQDLMREPELVGHTIRAVPVDKAKELRAAPWAARAEAGKVVLVRGEWVGRFLDEVTAFPRGEHDDQVDAVSGAVQMLAGSTAAKPFLVG